MSKNRSSLSLNALTLPKESLAAILRDLQVPAIGVAKLATWKMSADLKKNGKRQKHTWHKMAFT